MTSVTKPQWVPSEDRVQNAIVTDFMTWLDQQDRAKVNDFAGLHQWSVSHIADFWSAAWDYFDLPGEKGRHIYTRNDQDIKASAWFSQSKINFAENLLRYRGDQEALVFWGEKGRQRSLSRDEVYNEVSRLAQALKAQGVEPGDRVAGLMPNMPEAIVAMLATTAIGGVWSSASPDFGAQGILDRFGQIAPKVLIAPDSYDYNLKNHDVLGKVTDVVKEIPALEKVVVISWSGENLDLSGLDNAVDMRDFVNPFEPAEIAFSRQGFDHPLYIMFSSGTTGAPKCIVHRAGGALMKQLVEHKFHGDLKENDRLFYFTTCGWMMWNWFAAGLGCGATLICYDGSPFAGSPTILFDLAEQEKITHFGTSPKYLDTLKKAGESPIDKYKLPALRAIFSTGSPLLPEGFDFVYEHVKKDVQLASIAGGTDILGCFMLGNPIGAVYRGEIQTPALGCAVSAFSDEGKPVSDAKSDDGSNERGELVCTEPFPSMPLCFWGDEDGSRYNKAYFERFDNIWTHGDFLEITENGGLIIHGRSDATLNPGGVRIGTAEIYRQVETLEEIREAIVVGQNWDGDVRVVLCVILQDGVKSLDKELIKKIKTRIRTGCTPRHVPAKVVAVSDIPRTRSGKITELAVRDIINGREVGNKEALANPEALDLYRNISTLQED
ncbi:acetoacetyl-CoA synthetase [Kiloniella spongiae]|uniref:Acetoacetyl-CoA synthetase n=1 Tax=Kiloniella spongiae TaxID=1489064 RepID=A0A0H2MDX6_9PROT|nr:acetoacetate--CoA ligase [Kiloniella spongiae]KLN60739.1 acetoacetyl-CoA synthetase [Kiloniella spongiae]